jgi:hypothetical protein
LIANEKFSFCSLFVLLGHPIYRVGPELGSYI